MRLWNLQSTSQLLEGNRKLEKILDSLEKQILIRFFTSTILSTFLDTKCGRMLMNPFRINISSFWIGVFSLLWWNWPHLKLPISSLGVLSFFRVRHVKLSSHGERDAFQFALSQRLKLCSKAKMTKCIHYSYYRDWVIIPTETNGFELFLCSCNRIINNCFFLYFHHIVYRKLFSEMHAVYKTDF